MEKEEEKEEPNVPQTLPESKSKFNSDLDGAREKEYLRKIEAALFVAGKWLSLQELVMLTNVNPILLKMLISKLKERYEENEGAVQILQREELWKMDIKQEYRAMVGKLASGNSEFTKAEQSTLAIIAYKQPIKQSVVINIRGNKAYEHVKKFVQLNLVKGKRLGHTLELNLNDEFYNYFSLKPEDVEEGNIGRIELKIQEESDKTKQEDLK